VIPAIASTDRRKILLITNNPATAEMVERALKGKSADPRHLAWDLEWVRQLSHGVARLGSGEVAAVLFDLSLPDSRELEGMDELSRAAADVPVLVLCKADSEIVGLEAVARGAQDYLLPAHLDNYSLPRALRNAMERKASAQHDFLTGLPNRLLLNDRISQAIALSRRQQRPAAVLVLNLDDFKLVNESMGHAGGDMLLQSVAMRLLKSLRASDTVSRQSGDEFVILLSQVTSPEDVATAARKILLALMEPHAIDDHYLHIKGCIGISVFPDDGEDADSLILKAETAMRHVKTSGAGPIGHNSFHFFKPEMSRRVVERQSLESSLRQALRRREFLLQYQPKVNLETGQILGAEALLRWRQPERGLVPPAEFVPLAEDCGLIVDIGRWVLEEACQQARTWQRAGLPPLRIAINLSSAELGDEDFLYGVARTLADTGLAARYLGFDLVEGVLMKNPEATLATLHELKRMGIELAVDDYGTGSSSLSYLRQFPIDVLKIDHSFVRQITPQSDDSTMASAIIHMGKSLHYAVIAEGVETLEQQHYLKTHHCAEGQGYLFSRPLAAAQFAHLLEGQVH
jgi:diguanylate cyclase (GGDEF)-like protein